MNKIKRIISVLMCITLLTLSFSSCGTPETQEAPSETTVPSTSPTVSIDKTGYTIPHLRTDSLNPFECSTQTNRNIARLIFDPLFNVNNDFNVTGVVAESYSYTSDKVINVKIRQGLTFTDGTALTADDVVYSFVCAKNSDFYSPHLKNVIDGSSDGSGNVVFTLKNADPYEIANLNFPIIKKDSDKNTTSSDDYTSPIPIGSGRYTLVQENDTKKLVANTNRLGSFVPKYSFIGLRDITEEASIRNIFDIKEIDFYTESFDDGVYERYTGANSYFETTNLVYLGINSETAVLNDSKVRRALALLVDRSNISTVAFSGLATPTATPFHPSFYGIKGCSALPVKFDEDAAATLLDEAGFDKLSVSDTRYSDDGSLLELRLLVNKENPFKLAAARNIQQTLALANISVTIKEYSYADYLDAIEIGSYDLYLGEVNLPESFNLNVFFTENGGASFGIDLEGKSAEFYAQLLKGEKTMQEFLDAFADELPFIPLLYRKGITVRSSSIKTQSETIINDYLYNISEWTVE